MQLNCLDGVGMPAKTKACPKDRHCMYEVEKDKSGKVTVGPTMKCAPDPMPEITMDTCHTTTHGSHMMCYCMKNDCNHECKLKKDVKCTDKPGSAPKDEPTAGDERPELCNTKECVCDGMCMARTTNGNGTVMTMKTMMTEKATKMKTMESDAPPATTKMAKQGSEPAEMGTTSKSSTTDAAAFHVVVGMVIIIAMQFP